MNRSNVKDASRNSIGLVEAISGQSVKPDIVHLTAAYSFDHHRIYGKESCSALKAGLRVAVVGMEPQVAVSSSVTGFAPNVTVLKRHRSRLRFGTMWHLFKHAMRLRGRIIHAHEPQSLMVGVLVKFLTRCRLVYDAHEDYARTYAYNHVAGKYARSALRKAVACIEWFLCLFVDWVCVVDEHIGRRFARWHKRVSVVHNFPPLDFGVQQLSRRIRPKNAVYIGLLDRQIALPEMIESTAEVVKTHPDFELWLLGSGDDQFIQTYLAKTEALGISGNVKYFGRVPHAEIPKWLSAAGIGLILYGGQDNYQDESFFTVKMIEYMAYGLPLITSAFRGLRQTLIPIGCSVFVDPTQPQEIARQISGLLENPTLADAMGQAGYAAFRGRFNWDEGEAPKLLALYSFLLHEELGC